MGEIYMGSYTGIRFKGYVKEEFRKNFESVALKGDWENHHDPIFREFSKNERASHIPIGGLSYMPDSWESPLVVDGVEIIGEYVDGDGFDLKYDKETGYWTFQCSLKNYWSTIEEFFEILPYFIESIESLEYFYEEQAYSHKYELIENKVVLTNTRHILYKEYNL